MSIPIFDLINEEFSAGRSRAEIVQKLSTQGMSEDKAIIFINTAVLYKNKYWSRTNRLKRMLVNVFWWPENGVDQKVFQLLSDYLVSSGHYNSQSEIDQKISQQAYEINQAEISIGYRDDYYWSLEEYQKKIYFLMNQHFSDFEKPLQQRIFKVLNKDEIMKGVDSRAKFMREAANKL